MRDKPVPGVYFDEVWEIDPLVVCAIEKVDRNGPRPDLREVRAWSFRKSRWTQPLPRSARTAEQALAGLRWGDLRWEQPPGWPFGLEPPGLSRVTLDLGVFTLVVDPHADPQDGDQTTYEAARERIGAGWTPRLF